MGIKDIMRASKIVMIATGAQKAMLFIKSLGNFKSVESLPGINFTKT